MFTIYLTQIKDKEAFDLAIKKYIASLTAFNFEKKPKPRPSADHLIELAVKRVQVKGKADTFVPDYEVIDDTPNDSDPK